VNSFSELKCFLPDDSIKLTVVLNHAAISTWHKVLYDRLVIVSEQQEIRHESTSFYQHHHDANMMMITNNNNNNNNDLSMGCRLRDIKLVADGDTFKISGFIELLPFEIVGNGRVDLCMLAFFEEVAALVGNDHLLKRSVLLIRAWWWYETILEGNEKASPREYLPDCAIWMMTATIFNIYHRTIRDPLQVLYLFLRIYSNYDGRQEIITLYGIKKIMDNANSVFIDRHDREYLIPNKLYEKYYHVINVVIDGGNPMNITNTQQWKVDNAGLVILNPFTMENMTLEKLSIRKMEKIHNLFRYGYQMLLKILDETTTNNNNNNNNNNINLQTNRGSSLLVSTLFPMSMKVMLSSNGRPDTFSQSKYGNNQDYLEM
jgi:hypothetical protein